MNTIKQDQVKPGDKIVLKTDCGPEGAINRGTVEEVRETGVLTNFGLRYAYLIPFKAIKTHLKPIKSLTNKVKINTRKIKNKNQIKF